MYNLCIVIDCDGEENACIKIVFLPSLREEAASLRGLFKENPFKEAYLKERCALTI